MARRTGNLKKAVMVLRFRKANKHRVPLSKVRVKKAIVGSGGYATVIAKRLGCNIQSLYRVWHKPDWECVRAKLKEERERLLDVAEERIDDLIKQDDDLKVAASTARWYLERQGQHRGYTPKKELKVEGKIETTQPTISIENLNLSIDCRRQILAAMEAQDNPPTLRIEKAS